jgi:hypothetical protein
MGRNFFYCSELSDRAGEQAIGTASTGDVWMLLEYTRPWGYRAFQESNLSRAVKAQINRVLKTVPRSRILFIKQEREPAGAFKLFVVRSQESNTSIVRFELEDHAQLLDMDLESIVTGSADAGGGERWEKNLFLVCTHGKRDKCCAKFGFSLYKSLREQVGESVWQASHVGGDRFAANLICFPHGLFYAHVTEESGQRIISEYVEERVILENYRGRACYPSPIQAAEYFIRTESGLTGLNDLRFLDYAIIRERNWRARFHSTVDGRIHEVYLQSQLSEFQNLLTCHATEEKRVVQYSLSNYRVSG